MPADVSGGVGRVFAGRLALNAAGGGEPAGAASAGSRGGEGGSLERGPPEGGASAYLLSVTNDDQSATHDITVDLQRALGVAPSQELDARDLWRRAPYDSGGATVRGNWTLRGVPPLDTVLLRLVARTREDENGRNSTG